MSMHQMEDFIEQAVRAVATSSLPTATRRNLVFTLFNIRSYGDCGFTNLRTIDEMVECQYTSLFDATEMYDYNDHPEFYEDGHYYKGPDGTYYDKEKKKYCVDSGTKAWEIMVQKGKITGEAAEPVELMPFVEVFKVIPTLMGDMDPYIKEGFYCSIVVSEAFDEMTDEESLEILGKTKDDFEDFLENGGEDADEGEELDAHEALTKCTKVCDILGTQVSFVVKSGMNEQLDYLLNGFKSKEGVTLDIFGERLPLSLEICPFAPGTAVNIFEIMKEISTSDCKKAVRHINEKSANHPLFDVLVNNILFYLQPIKDDPHFIENAARSYKLAKKIDESVEIKPVAVRLAAKVGYLCLTTEIFITLRAEGDFSCDIHYEYKNEIINECDLKDDKANVDIIRNINKQQYFYVGEADSSLFGEISVSIDVDGHNFEYATQCVRALNNLSEKIIDDLCAYSVLYCEDFCDAVGEEPPTLEVNRDILKHVHSVSLIVKEPKDESVIIHLSFECDWEEEHGMEWLIKDGKILHVGAYSDEPAYAEESYYHNSWNYANLKK